MPTSIPTWVRCNSESIVKSVHFFPKNFPFESGRKRIQKFTMTQWNIFISFISPQLQITYSLLMVVAFRFFPPKLIRFSSVTFYFVHRMSWRKKRFKWSEYKIGQTSVCLCASVCGWAAHAFAHSQKGGLLFVNASWVHDAAAGLAAAAAASSIRWTSVKSNIYLKYQHRNCFALLLILYHSSFVSIKTSVVSNDIIIGRYTFYVNDQQSRHRRYNKIPFGWIKTKMNKTREKKEKQTQKRLQQHRNVRGKCKRWSVLFDFAFVRGYWDSNCAMCGRFAFPL